MMGTLHVEYRSHKRANVPSFELFDDLDRYLCLNANALRFLHCVVF